MSRGSSVPSAIKTALDAIDYLPNGVAAWVAAHGGDRALADANAKKLRQAEELMGQILASMPASTEYQVSGLPGISGVSKFASLEDFTKTLANHGIKRTGTETGTRLRPELVGAPKFNKLVGPMYGGPGVVRYETAEVYDSMSR